MTNKNVSMFKRWVPAYCLGNIAVVYSINPTDLIMSSSASHVKDSGLLFLHGDLLMLRSGRRITGTNLVSGSQPLLDQCPLENPE